ncbi:MAG: hypothetical protein QF741_00915 [Candidatus Peribacteraceae bacterium]|nr:hypothetical protein [Candidatus Peribacteraceae bacterium]MDP7454242.1 hypothetical protein [Candidatus Peribacteraceae bacterium]MDP7645834.1 hypothetical protein [Candidatus Peribacteraceae bacterium]
MCLKRCISSPWFYVFLMTLALLVSFIEIVPYEDRDFKLYQAFVEALASGRFDLSIPGFHGSNIPAALVHIIIPSKFTEIYYQLIWSLLLPALAYLTGKELFKSTTAPHGVQGSAWHGLVLAGVVTMMPFWTFKAFIGYTTSAYIGLMLLTIYGACKKSWWTWIVWGLAMTTKPFALVLLPLLWIKRPTKGSVLRRNQLIILGLAIPALYAAIQYIQVGHLIVGVHPDLSETSVWQSPMKVILNLAYSLQILFSVHNYHFPDPGGTGHQNLMHTSPLLIFLALIAFLAPKLKYIEDKKLYWALLIGALGGLLMNAVVSTMNHEYMHASILLFILASLPVLKKYQLWIPLVLATLHFQWFYFYLAWAERHQLTYQFFTVPILIDVMFVIYVAPKFKRCFCTTQ